MSDLPAPFVGGCSLHAVLLVQTFGPHRLITRLQHSQCAMPASADNAYVCDFYFSCPYTPRRKGVHQAHTMHAPYGAALLSISGSASCAMAVHSGQCLTAGVTAASAVAVMLL
jgi:hypothetical protein